MDFRFTKTKTRISLIASILVFLFYLIKEIEFASSLRLVIPNPIEPKYDVIVFFSLLLGLIFFIAIFLTWSLIQSKQNIKKK